MLARAVVYLYYNGSYCWIDPFLVQYRTQKIRYCTRKQWPIDAWQTNGRLPLRHALEFIFATSSFVPDSRLFEGKAQQSRIVD